MKKLYLSLLVASTSFALPQGERVVQGEVSKEVRGSELIITTSDKAILDYESYSIGRDESVTYVQPSSNSCVLNRVRGNEISEICGQLNANGHLFLVNPHGVYFGEHALVNIGSFIASTLDIANTDFTDEKYTFVLKKEGGSIVNRGSIRAEGSVAFLAPHIQNEGAVIAKTGSVVLAAARKVTLDFSGDGLLRFVVDEELIPNDRYVAIEQESARSLIRDVVNVEGVQEGVILVERDGVIEILGASSIQAEEVAIEGSCVKARDSIEGSTQLIAGGGITIAADEIDFFLLENPESMLGCHGPLTLISDRPISADAHFTSGDFALQKKDGSAGDFTSRKDPIISATGSVSFGAYTGASLLVQSTGQIESTGAIVINIEDTTTFVPETPDTIRLNQTPSLIFRSGLNGLVPYTPDLPVPPSQTLGGTSATPTGATPSSIILNDDITTVGGPIILSSILGMGEIVLGADVTLTSGGGDVTLHGFVEGPQNLTINAGGGDLSIRGGIGATTPLSGLNVTASSTALTANIATSAGGISFDSNVNLGQPVTISSSGGAVTFTGLIDGGQTLSVDAGAGDVAVNGSMGSIVPLGTLSISGQNITISNAVQSSGSMTVTNAGLLTLPASSGFSLVGSFLQNGVGVNSLEGSFETMGGDIVFETVVTLTGGADFTTHGGDVRFLSALNGAHSLSIGAGAGSVVLGGAVSSLEGLSISSAHDITFASTASVGASGITLNHSGDCTLSESVMTTGPFAQTGSGATLLNSSVTTTNTSLSFAGPITLTGMGNISSGAGAGDIQLGAIDGGHPLVIDAGTGAIVFDGPIGVTAEPTTLTANGGAITFSEEVNLSGNLALTNTGLVTIEDRANVSLGGFFSQMGGGSTSLSANIVTAAAPILFSDPVVLGSGTHTLDTGSGEDVTFSSTLDGPGGLTCSAGTGVVTFGATIGGVTPLESLSITSANTLNFNGAIDIGSGGVSLHSTSPLSLGQSITTHHSELLITTSLILTAGVTFDTGVGLGGIDLAAVEGTENLTLTAGLGTVNLNGSIGATDRLSTVDLSGGDVNLNSTLRADTLIIDASEQVDCAGAIDLTGVATITNGDALKFQAGANVSCDSFLQNGSGEVILFADITTLGGAITFEESIFLGDDAVLSSGGGAMTLNAVDGGANLTLDAGIGVIVLNGAIGSSERLGNLTFSGATIDVNDAVEANDVFATTTGAMTFQDLFDLTGNITMTNGGVLTLNSWLLQMEGGNIVQNGAGAVSLDSMLITMGGDISFASGVSLPSTTMVETDGGDLLFSGSLEGPGDLFAVLETGSGTFTGAVGGGTPLGSLHLQSLNNATFESAVSVVTFEQANGSGLTQFDSTLTTSGAPGVNLVGNQFTFNGAVTTLSGGPFLINNSGAVTIPTGSNVASDGNFFQLGSGITNLGAGITTTGDPLFFEGEIALTNDVTLTTGMLDGDITLGEVSGPHTLIAAGGAGQIMLYSDIDISGSLTLTGSSISVSADILTGIDVNCNGPTILLEDTSIIVGNDLVFSSTLNGPFDLVVSSGNDATFTGTVDVGSLTQTSGSGTTLFSSTLDTSNGLGINLSTNILTFTGNVTTIGGGSVVLGNSGALTLPPTVSSDDAFMQTGVGSVFLGGLVQCNGGELSFSAPVNLTALSILDSQGGDITTTNIDGGFNLLVDSDIGSIDLQAVGSTTPIIALQIGTNPSSVQITSIDADSLVQTGGTGTSTYGSINASGALGIDMTGAAFTFTGDVTTLAGPMEVTNAGLLTIDAGTTFSIDTTFTQNGAGSNLIAGSIGSMGGGVTFTTVTTLSDDLQIMGAPIQFLNTLNGTNPGTENLTLMPMSGSVSLGFVGLTTPLGDVEIQNTPSSIDIALLAASSYTQQGGTTATYGGFSTSGSGGVTLSGNVININGTVTAINGGGVVYNNSGLLTIAVGADHNVTGTFAQVGAGNVELGATFTTFALPMSFASPVALLGNSSFTSNGGDITFSDTVSNAHDVTLSAGSGNIDLQGALLGVNALSITSAGDFDAQVITAQSIEQLAGTGTTTLNGAWTSTTFINLSTGNIVLDGDVTLADTVDFNATGTISNAGLSQNINVVTSASVNSLVGDLGSILSPIRINTLGPITVGADGTAYLSGITFHNYLAPPPAVFEVSGNPPSSIIFNGILIKP